MAEQPPPQAAFHELLLDASVDGVLAFDREFRYTAWNRAMERISGLARAQVLGRRAFEVFPFLLDTGEDRYFHEALAGRSAVSAARPYAVPESGRRGFFDGYYSPLYDERGQIVGGVAVIRDITERKAAEDALRASEERYRAFIGNSSEGIWRFELEQPASVALPADEQIELFYRYGYLAECNDAMARMYGYERAEEITGARLGDLLVRADPKNVAYLRAFIAADYRLTDAESVEVDREGRTRIFSNNLVGVVKDGHILRAWGTQRDVTERQRIADELRATQHRFFMFMENLPGLAWIKDAAGRYVYANEAAARAFRVPRAALPGKTDEELFPPATAAAFRENDLLALARDEGVLTVETLTHTDGVHYSIVSKFRIPGPDGATPLVGGIAIDITERMRAEEAIRASERRLQLIADHAPVLITYCAADRTYKFVNEPYAARFGLRPAELVGRPFHEVMGPEAYAAIAPYVDAALRGERVEYEAEIPYRGIGTRHMWVAYAPEWDDAGRVVGFVGALIDITERKRTEVALRESEERFAKAFAASPLALIITSLKTGRLLEVNETFTGLTGYTREEAVGRTTLELGLWVEQADREEELGLLSARGRVRAHEYRFRMKDGTERTGLLSAEQIEIGGAPCALTVVEDITEQKRAEVERERLLAREQALRAKAEETNRLKDEFLSVVSHELRTPLTAMLGWAHMLRAGGLDDATRRLALDIIERNARAQAQLVDDVLDVSRIITGKLRLDMRRLDPAQPVAAALDAVRPAAEAKGVRLEVALDAEAGPVLADADRLQQVAWNLLTNAVKFTPSGGRIEVRLERAAGHVRLTVSDTGQGIAAEFLPHVFERFRQADSSSTREHGGLGLGLSIVRHLVEMHGGTVSAESAGAGQGASFTVLLPVAGARKEQEHAEAEQNGGAASDQAASRDPQAAILSGLRVLAVDDEQDTRDLLLTVFTRCGAEARAVPTAAAALEAWQSWQPDVLVSDIGMPREDGYALISRVRAGEREQGRRTTALALTGYARPEDRQKALSAGFDAHVAKPINPDALVNLVAELTGRRAREASPAPPLVN
ncbi:MAG TPA: PAS domain S-box protein [Pyrinomonadaceae bacterium]